MQLSTESPTFGCTGHSAKDSILRPSRVFGRTRDYTVPGFNSPDLFFFAVEWAFFECYPIILERIPEGLDQEVQACRFGFRRTG